MAAHLSAFAAAVLIALAGVPAATLARGLQDPTQPPANAARQPDATAMADAPPRAPAQLQMIVRGPGETRTALIDGRALRVGDALEIDGGSARVVAIAEGAVRLRRADGSTTSLELNAAAEAIRCKRRIADHTQPCGATATHEAELTTKGAAR